MSMESVVFFDALVKSAGVFNDPWRHTQVLGAKISEWPKGSGIPDYRSISAKQERGLNKAHNLRTARLNKAYHLGSSPKVHEVPPYMYPGNKGYRWRPTP
jgi:hypothetical protein